MVPGALGASSTSGPRLHVLQNAARCDGVDAANIRVIRQIFRALPHKIQALLERIKWPVECAIALPGARGWQLPLTMT